MGYEKHHGIIVSSWDEDNLKKAHKKAKEIFRNDVTNILKGRCNFVYTFFIGPDGSKEGWPESNDGDMRRIQFQEFVIEIQHVQAVEVVFYDEEDNLEIRKIT